MRPDLSPLGFRKTPFTRELSVPERFALSHQAEATEARYQVRYVKVTGLSRRDLCKEMAAVCGLSTAGTHPALVRTLQNAFEHTVGTDGRRPVLVLDEAHDLRPEPLATLRLRSRDETRAYVAHRCAVAGAQEAPFDSDAHETIFLGEPGQPARSGSSCPQIPRTRCPEGRFRRLLRRRHRRPPGALAVSEPLPILPVHALEEPPTHARWLVRELWGAEAVGIIGGALKACKSWLALDLALSVASGTACLGRFEVHRPGPVVAYLAEDALPQIRHRVDQLCQHRGLALRGSSDLHAWNDSACYLARRADGRLALTVQHRAAPAPESLLLRLAGGHGAPLHLLVDADPAEAPSSLPLADAVRAELRKADGPLSTTALRQRLRVNNARLGDTLLSLEKRHLAVRGPKGWSLPPEVDPLQLSLAH